MTSNETTFEKTPQYGLHSRQSRDLVYSTNAEVKT